nr:hypothetical protein [Tanacetum cinerariifolium]
RPGRAREVRPNSDERGGERAAPGPGLEDGPRIGGAAQE